MKKASDPSNLLRTSTRLGAFAIASLAFSSVASAVVLYSTTEDFAEFESGMGATSTTFYSVSDTVNGVGNTTAPGGVGTVGSLQFASTVGFTVPTGANFTGPTDDAFQGFAPGSTRPYSAESGGLPGNMLATSGTFTFDINTTNLEGVGYDYYGFGIVLNYDNNFATFFPTSSTNFTGADGNTWAHVEVPYTTNAETLNYFGWGILENSGGTGVGGETVYVDNIQVTAVPEPATVACLLGGVGLFVLRRRVAR